MIITLPKRSIPSKFRQSMWIVIGLKMSLKSRHWKDANRQLLFLIHLTSWWYGHDHSHLILARRGSKRAVRQEKGRSFDLHWNQQLGTASTAVHPWRNHACSSRSTCPDDGGLLLPSNHYRPLSHSSSLLLPFFAWLPKWYSWIGYGKVFGMWCDDD